MSYGVSVAQFRASSVCIYEEPLFSPSYSKLNFRVSNMEKQRLRRYIGKMSGGAKKRMIRAISLMVQNSKPIWITNPVTDRLQLHRLSFITLTVSSSDNITAREAYDKLFSHFLQWLRRTKGVKMYIWKAELQQRGQIHYHITTPTFLHYKEIRDKWNELQLNAGFLKEYAAEHGHTNPNSTDVHEVRETKKMDFYLIKELAKTIDGKRLHSAKIVDSLIKAGEIEPDQRTAMINDYTGADLATDGKIWDCSENLSAFKLFNTEFTTSHELKLQHMVKAGHVREMRGDFWTMYYFEHASPPDLLNDHERKKFIDHIGQVHTYVPTRARKQEIESMATRDAFLKSHGLN